MKRQFTCMIVDDSTVDAAILAEYLELIPEINIVATFHSPQEAKQYAQVHKPEIILTDIEMPELSGIDLAKSLTYKPIVVFLSNHRDFGSQSYEVDAFYYLCKPIAPEQIQIVLHKAIKELGKQLDDDLLIIRSESQFVALQKSAILYLEAEDKLVKIHLQQARQHLVWISLKAILEQLNDTKFIRIHRSFAVNTRFVNFVSNNEVIIGQKSLPLSEQYRQEMMDKFIKKHLITK